MPYKRSYRKKSFRKKRPFYRKRRVYRRIPRNRSISKTYMFKRHVDLGTVALSNAAAVSGGISFQLDEVPNYTEFTALFDVYRIAAVKITCYVNASDIQVQSASPFSVVRWISVIDYNSSGSFGSFNDAREFQSSKMSQYPFPYPKSRYLKPKMISSVENDATSIVAAGNKKGWLNTTVANIPHYGYRYIFEQLAAPYTGSIKFEGTYYLMFRQVK